MNNKTFEYLKHKINKFGERANLELWHDNVLMSARHRFSLRKSEINYSIRNIQSIPFPNETFIVACNNDVLFITSRMPQEVEEWNLLPTDIYDWIVGESTVFALEWDVIVEVPTNILNPVMNLFEIYYGWASRFPIMTVAVAKRIPHEIYNGEVIYLPNSSLFPEEFTWALKMQRARIDGREIPPRPEVLLGERLRHEGLYDGIEWEGAE